MPISKEECVIVAYSEHGVGQPMLLGREKSLKDAREKAQGFAAKDADYVYKVYQLAAAFKSEQIFTVKEL